MARPCPVRILGCFVLRRRLILGRTRVIARGITMPSWIQNLIENKFFMGIVFLLLLGLDLVACSPPANPLLTQDLKTVAQVLSAAEQAASNAHVLSFSTGSAYVRCMTDPQSFSTPRDSSVGPKKCDGLFRFMVEAASHTKGFENLNLEDLKDPKAFKRIRGPLSAVDSGEDFEDNSGDPQ